MSFPFLPKKRGFSAKICETQIQEIEKLEITYWRFKRTSDRIKSSATYPCPTFVRHSHKNKMDKNDKITDLVAHAPTDNVQGADFPAKTIKHYKRYSDEDLQEFRTIVLAKLQEAQVDYDDLKSTIRKDNHNGTDDTSPGFKLMEDATEGFSREEMSQLAIRQLKFIENLKNALVRIENKTYGICKVSGKLIAKERLRSVPHTTMCIDAKLEKLRYN